jgi:hypothetical protein
MSTNPPNFTTEALERIVRDELSGEGINVLGLGIDFWGDPVTYGQARYVRIFGATTTMDAEACLTQLRLRIKRLRRLLHEATGVAWVVVLYDSRISLGQEADVYVRMTTKFSK